MKHILLRVCLSAIVALLVTLIIPGHTAAAQDGLTKIADAVYAYIDERNPVPSRNFGANAGIIIGRDGIVVVDTLISSKEAQRFIKDIKVVSDKPVKYVVNTHYHLDHSLGNADFARLGATIVGHINCKKNIHDNAEVTLQRAKDYGLTDEMMQGTKIAEPSLVFDSRMEIDLGDRKVELLYTRVSHTDGSILVYLPDTKMLFAGDILFTNFHPNMRDGDIESWIKVLDHILEMDVAAIIPGHGPLSTKKDVREMREYLVAFDRIAKEQSAKGMDAATIAAEIKTAVPKRDCFEMFIASNIKAKYLKK